MEAGNRLRFNSERTPGGKGSGSGLSLPVQSAGKCWGKKWQKWGFWGSPLASVSIWCDPRGAKPAWVGAPEGLRKKPVGDPGMVGEPDLDCQKGGFWTPKRKPSRHRHHQPPGGRAVGEAGPAGQEGRPGDMAMAGERGSDRANAGPWHIGGSFLGTARGHPAEMTEGPRRPSASTSTVRHNGSLSLGA